MVDGGGEAVNSGGDAAEILQTTKYALDGVVFSGEETREADRASVIDLVRNVRCSPCGFRDRPAALFVFDNLCLPFDARGTPWGPEG